MAINTSDVVFTAEFDDGCFFWFHAPQTWRHVFSTCKLHANGQKTVGRIFCNGKLVRKIGA